MRDGHRLLREATREAHERRDALFTGFDLTTPQGYRRFIGAQAEAMLAVEAALDEAGADRVLDDWPDRRRGAALRADAAALGLAVSDTPDVTALRGNNPQARIAGALYVVEGSRHGARHLRKLVPEGEPTTFLDSDQPAGNWAKLLAVLDGLMYQPQAQQAAIASALDIFGVFECSGRAWLARD